MISLPLWLSQIQPLLESIMSDCPQRQTRGTVPVPVCTRAAVVWNVEGLSFGVTHSACVTTFARVMGAGALILFSPQSQ